MSDALWWLVVAGIFVVLEVGHRAFYAAFLAVGALTAAVAALAGAPFAAQIPIFAVAAVAGLFMARPPLMRAMSRGQYRMISGAQGLVGHEAIVTARVADLRAPGKVRIQGEEWKALSSDGKPIEPGTVVMILELQGSTFIVQHMPELDGSFPELSEDDT
ncbi:MAG: NfeD family protein [Actinomycetota bacterium]|nr:NfeD family protein [Actinomycetota bacterium]